MLTYLAHHGIKGQRWGVRRYRYEDGTLTPAGRKRYGVGLQSDVTASTKVSTVLKMSVKEAINQTRFRVTGRQYVDSYLKKGTEFSRIQTSSNFENFAFYATYNKEDSDKYMGLFGKNLKSRAAAEARSAEKQANASGSEEDLAKAQELRAHSDSLKVYQLKIEATKKLKIPSDDNAADITTQLLKNSEFKANLKASLDDSQAKMKRPSQQILFKQAQNALKRDPSTMTSAEKIAVYKAFNLSLTNHNAQEIAAQDAFYNALKKKGYNALLDYNDKEYSSYHAKRPMIVFDTSAVKLKAVLDTNPAVVEKMYSKYNAQRMRKEVRAETVGLVSQYMAKTVNECTAASNRLLEQYLNSGKK